MQLTDVSLYLSSPPAAPPAAWILSLFGLSWQENAPQLPPVQLPLAASVSPVKCGCCMSATAYTSGRDKGSLRAKGSKKTCSDEDERVEKCTCTKGVRVATLETNSWKLLCVSRPQYVEFGDWGLEMSRRGVLVCGRKLHRATRAKEGGSVISMLDVASNVRCDDKQLCNLYIWFIWILNI